MITRSEKQEVHRRLTEFPAVAIMGPRQVGKTTLALEIAKALPTQAIYLDLESPSDRAKLADAEAYLRLHSDKLVILDEIHRMPEIFQALRGIIDENRRAGRRNRQFILLGSAAIDLMRQSGETLAGRITYVELFPFHVLEVSADGEAKPIDRLHLRGGFPDSFLAKSDAASVAWRRDFIRTYLQRDIPQFGPRIAEETLRRFWTMLAHLHGGLLNAASLSRSLGVDAKTVTSYLDLMVDLLLVRRLAPWHANVGKRLVKSPKVYVRDTGLMHALLQIENHEQLLAHPQLGDSYEGFVIENLLAIAGDGAVAHFYRTAAGAEIDLVIEKSGQRYAIEIKRSTAPSVTKGFHLACEDVKPSKRWLIYPGTDRFPLGNGLEAIGLSEAMQELARP